MSHVDPEQVRALMKRCQVGVPKHADAYNALHGILAECYGTLGAQQAEIERLRTRLEVPDPPFEAHDGISCRDETIKLLDHNADVLREALKLAKAEIERLGTLISP